MIDSIRDEVLKKHTGKIWKDWITILNQAGARHWNHQEIVTFLKSKHKQSVWWRQMVANGFEVSVGKRIAGQSLKGTYSTTVTKTVEKSHLQVWKWCVSAGGLAIWLKPLAPVALRVGDSFEVDGGIFGEVRTLKKGQRIRLRWQEEDSPKPMVVQLLIVKRAKAKAMIAISHEGIRTAAQKTRLHKYWREILNEIAESLRT